jgi:hypothetical protein
MKTPQQIAEEACRNCKHTAWENSACDECIQSAIEEVIQTQNEKWVKHVIPESGAAQASEREKEKP